MKAMEAYIHMWLSLYEIQKLMKLSDLLFKDTYICGNAV